MKEKTADEMFEELGYNKTYSVMDDDVLMIGYGRDEEPVEKSEIIFLKKAKKIILGISIGMQELQAINKKCQELGWLDD